MSWLGQVTEQRYLTGSRLPLIVQPIGNRRENLAEFSAENRDKIDERLLEHGALLFRGFHVPTAAEFSTFVDGISNARLDYIYRSTPRTTVENKVFTATQYPANLHIPLHNENAYQRDWPTRIAFYCAVAATSGGETPIADMRRVSDRMGDIVDRFEHSGVKYVRNYSPGTDLPWQTVFQTDDPSAVAQYCRTHGITFEWISQSTLRTSQVCQGAARHPVTGERLFFNQAHLFHVSSLGPEIAQNLIDLFGIDNLPRNSFYGDGRPISDDILTAVRDAFSAEAISFPWKAGDVLLLDNMQVAHGRRPYSGPREVLVALSDPYSALVQALA